MRGVVGGGGDSSVYGPLSWGEVGAVHGNRWSKGIWVNKSLIEGEGIGNWSWHRRGREEQAALLNGILVFTILHLVKGLVERDLRTCELVDLNCFQ
jgi:hypothetical protein